MNTLLIIKCLSNISESTETGTFQLLCVAQQELIRVLNLQVKLDGLQQDALQHHHLLL